MKDGKFSIGTYLVALFGGVAAGAMFSKAMYHKGLADAYKDASDSLQRVIDETEKMLEEREQKES